MNAQQDTIDTLREEIGDLEAEKRQLKAEIENVSDVLARAQAEAEEKAKNMDAFFDYAEDVQNAIKAIDDELARERAFAPPKRVICMYTHEWQNIVDTVLGTPGVRP